MCVCVCVCVCVDASTGIPHSTQPMSPSTYIAKNFMQCFSYVATIMFMLFLIYHAQFCVHYNICLGVMIISYNLLIYKNIYMHDHKL